MIFRTACFVFSMVFLNSMYSSEVDAAPRSLLCTFSQGSKLVFDRGKLSGTDQSYTENHRYLFYDFDEKLNVGVFRNIDITGEGHVYILDNGEKLDLVEKNLSDNGFIVTVFYNKSIDGFIPAVYSQHGFDQNLDFFLPRQQIGMCR